MPPPATSLRDRENLRRQAANLRAQSRAIREAAIEACDRSLLTRARSLMLQERIAARRGAELMAQRDI